MLSADNLFVKGRHSPLLPPTSLTVRAGELFLACGGNQSVRTALALTLSGRMRPTSGSVSWGRDPRPEHLRRHAALLDSPEVSEPERHLRVRDLVAEDLALIPRRSRPRTGASAWLSGEGLADLGPLWIEELDASARLDLLLRLALADAAVDLLVVDSPDRHGPDPDAWLPLLAEAVSAAGRQVTAVAVVAQLPAEWTGPSAVAGDTADTNAGSGADTAGTAQTAKASA
ncbi:ABC transporter ATP-binding protein [Arthrobacter sp. YD2]|uniref:ABC transporter ATP-binding protein n=1 Tax=Arthrobacter sp. YD2 TaxID=3058046 RepID=UPI0025B4EDE2|nr:ABC transporter ATP-binding protein [Arthrobacter sp. YD2]MDN3905936.1 ABC transporter ATP-binding protein [Arthrobacter sp. YD2]